MAESSSDQDAKKAKSKAVTGAYIDSLKTPEGQEKIVTIELSDDVGSDSIADGASDIEQDSSPVSIRSIKPQKQVEPQQQEERLVPGAFVHAPALNYLNRNWNFPQAVNQQSGNTSITSGVRRLFRRVFLGDYVEQQQAFQQQLVHYLNLLTKEFDGRIWQDIRDEHSASYHSLERKLTGDFNRAYAILEKDIAELAVAQKRFDERCESLETVTRGLERVVSSMSRTLKGVHDAFIVRLENSADGEGSQPQSNTDDDSVEPSAAPEYDYFMFENRFRGSEAQIRERLSIYPPLFADVSAPVLEIGAGRGELQALFRSNGVDSYGFDLNDAFVEEAKTKNLDVRCGDGIAHLCDVANESLGGVIAVQVVEHLSTKQLVKLIQLCARRVAKGGFVVFETVNTESIVALSQNYFRDPSHKAPLHPDTLSFACETAGLEVKELRRLSEFPSEVCLQEISTQSFMTPRWHELVDTVNFNVRSLNQLLFGYQDYCVIAQVPYA